MKKWEEMPFTVWEQTQIDRMVVNGVTLEDAKKTRYAERRRKKVLQVRPPSSVTINVDAIQSGTIK